VSFVITLFVREGIVIASDSRLTLNTTEQSGQNQTVRLAVGQSDSNYKTFLTPTEVGMATYGAADIAGVPIGGYIESFIDDVVRPKSLEVDAVAQEILKYFQALPAIPDAHFLVAGYKKLASTSEQQVWQVSVAQGQVIRVNAPGVQGAQWGGESDIVTRLVNAVGTLDANGALQAALPSYQIPWNFFTLQDAIDFAIFAVRSTIDALRFQPRPKTVGGPIDVLVIKPTGSQWVQRKGLRVTP
jgi:hypothetical protein